MLESERLKIRRFLPSDWEDLYAYLSKEEVVKFEPYGVSSIDECKEMAVKRTNSECFWAVCLKENNKLIGNLYFEQQEPKQFSTWILGYVFNPSYYGNGYATEACQRILRHGFEEHNAHRIIARCNTENVASWKVLERLNMRREGHFLKPAFFKTTDEGEPIWHDAYQYSILKEAYYKDTFLKLEIVSDTQLTESLRQFVFKDNHNLELDIHIYCLMHNKKVMVFDTGYAEQGQYIRQLLSEEGYMVETVWLTHYHPDHAAGAVALQAETVAASEHYMENFINCSVHWDVETLYVKPNLLLKQSDVFTFGPHKIFIHEVPGHSRCSLIFDVDDRYLLIGDLIMKDIKGQLTFPYMCKDGSFLGYEKGFQIIEQLKNRTLLLSHGTAMVGVEKDLAVGILRAYFSDLQKSYDKEESSRVVVHHYEQKGLAFSKWHFANMENRKE